MANRSQVLKAALRQLEAGKPTGALDLLAPWIEAHPDDADAHALKGQAYSAQGGLAEALKAFEAAVRLRPDRAGFKFNLGMAYLAAGRNQDAADTLASLADDQSQDAALLEALGTAYLGLRDPDTAKAYLSRALAVEPKSPSALTHLGDAFQRSGDGAKAQGLYRQALAVAPTFVPALNNLGAALTDGGDYGEAQTLLQRAVGVDPRHTRAIINLGMAQLHMGRLKEALTCFETCLRLDPLNRWGIAYRDLTRLQLGQLNPQTFTEQLEPLITQEDLAAPYSSFAQDLAAEVVAHPNRRWDVSGTATTNGYDALDLFAHQGAALKAFETLLRAAIDRRISAMPFERGHPLMGWKPEDYRLDIWATFLRNGGYQYAHIHPTGWLSGVYYVQLPTAGGATAMGAGGGNKDLAGWIEFGPPDQAFPAPIQPEPLHFEPRVGRLFLFPSYAYHRTIPFTGDTDRISIAFDVRP